MTTTATWVWASSSSMRIEAEIPRWAPPSKAAWDYTAFGTSGPAAAPDETINLKFEKIPGGRGGYNRWTINGKSWPHTNPLLTVQRGKRYRLAMNNNSGDEHPVHLHRHSFESPRLVTKHIRADEGHDQHAALFHGGDRLCG